VTPNSDTPYSLVQMDLRAEPMVACVPAIDKKRTTPSNSSTCMRQLRYIGSRATGNDAVATWSPDRVAEG